MQGENDSKSGLANHTANLSWLALVRIETDFCKEILRHKNMAENIMDREARFRSVSPLILEVENVLLCPGRRELRRRRDGLPRLLPRHRPPPADALRVGLLVRDHRALVRERRLAKFRQNVARFRLYRLRFLQLNMRFAAFFKIYQII